MGKINIFVFKPAGSSILDMFIYDVEKHPEFETYSFKDRLANSKNLTISISNASRLGGLLDGFSKESSVAEHIETAQSFVFHAE